MGCHAAASACLAMPKCWHAPLVGACDKHTRLSHMAALACCTHPSSAPCGLPRARRQRSDPCVQRSIPRLRAQAGRGSGQELQQSGWPAGWLAGLHVHTRPPGLPALPLPLRRLCGSCGCCRRCRRARRAVDPSAAPASPPSHPPWPVEEVQGRQGLVIGRSRAAIQRRVPMTAQAQRRRVRSLTQATDSRAAAPRCLPPRLCGTPSSPLYPPPPPPPPPPGCARQVHPQPHTPGTIASTSPLKTRMRSPALSRSRYTGSMLVSTSRLQRGRQVGAAGGRG